MNLIRPLKPIDLLTMFTAFPFSYFFREAMLNESMTWPLASLLVIGILLGVGYHYQGSAPAQSARSDTFHLLTAAALFIPAVVLADGWNILMAWLLMVILAITLSVPMFIGWMLPVMCCGRAVPR